MAKVVASSATSSIRGSVLIAVSLIIGALVLRMFVLPTRTVLSVKPVFENAQQYNIRKEQTSIISERNTVPLNLAGTMAIDIISIDHFPEEATIIVTLKPDGRCPNPYLLGRLSGPALVVLEWSSPLSANDNSKFGSYHVPISGQYFVEIIAVTCLDFSHDLAFDFQSTCVEDVMNHRLTAYNSKIRIDKDQSATAAPTIIVTPSRSGVTGYWLHQQDERAANNDYSAMYTRFQPRGCMRLDDPTYEHFENPPDHCIEPTDLNRFEPFTIFQYYREKKGSRTLTPSAVVPSGPQALRTAKPTTICLVGASHSRTLFASMTKHHNITIANNNIHIEWINAKLFRDVNNKTIPELVVGKCDKIILGIGQWSASFSGNKPMRFPDYRLRFRKLIGRLQHFLRRDVEIFARSIHYNPLNVINSGYCPPRDWRSPTVIDGYNAIIQNACHDIADAVSSANLATVRFVDTDFIVKPLWDASSDWGHVCPQASHVEAWYLVAVAVGLLDSPISI